MANRGYVEQVRDRLGGVVNMAADMNRGQFDGELEDAVNDLKRACLKFDGWLVRDRERSRRRRQCRLVRVSMDCVIRRREQ